MLNPTPISLQLYSEISHTGMRPFFSHPVIPLGAAFLLNNLLFILGDLTQLAGQFFVNVPSMTDREDP